MNQKSVARTSGTPRRGGPLEALEPPATDFDARNQADMRAQQTYYLTAQTADYEAPRTPITSLGKDNGSEPIAPVHAHLSDTVKPHALTDKAQTG